MTWVELWLSKIKFKYHVLKKGILNSCILLLHVLDACIKKALLAMLSRYGKGTAFAQEIWKHSWNWNFKKMGGGISLVREELSLIASSICEQLYGQQMCRTYALLDSRVLNTWIITSWALRLYLGKTPIEPQLPQSSLTQSFRILACGVMSHGDEISREKDILKISFETTTGSAFAL